MLEVGLRLPLGFRRFFFSKLTGTYNTVTDLRVPEFGVVSARSCSWLLKY